MGAGDTLTLRIEIQDDGSAVIRDVKGEIRDLADETKRSSSESQGAWTRLQDRVNEFGSSTAVQIGEAGLLGAIVAFTTTSVTKLAEFNDKMIDVQKTTEMTDDEIKSLGDALREMAVNDLKGMVAAETLAEISEQAGQMGTRGVTNLEAFSKALAMMDVATDLTATEAAEKMGDLKAAFREALEATGKSFEQYASNIGSSMNALSAVNNATVGNIMEVTRRIAGASSTIKLSIDQAAALAATIKDSGIDIEVGGTAVSKFMLKLAEDSDSFAEQFGLNAKKLATALETDPMEAITMVLQGMDSLADSKGPGELSKALNKTIGADTRLKDALLKLSGATEKLDENLQTSATAFEENVSLQNEFANKAESNISKWQGIGEKSNEVFRSFGEEIKPATDLLTDWASGGADVVIAAAKEWQGGVKTEFFDALAQQIEEKKGLIGVLTKVVEGHITVYQKVGEGIGTAFGLVEEGVEQAQRGYEKFQTKVGEVKTAADQFFTDVKALPSDLAEEFEAGMERITGTVTQTFDDAKAAVTRFGEAMNASVFQNEQAIGFFQKLTDKIYGVETALEKKSLTPALRRYIQAALDSGESTGQLTDEMRQNMESVLETDRAFQQNKRSIVEQQNEVRRLSIQIREQENAMRTASKAEQAGIHATLAELRNKKAERQNQIDLLRIKQKAVEATLELNTETVRTYQDEHDVLAALNKEREASLQVLKNASYAYQQEQQQIARANDALQAYYSSTNKATDDIQGTQQATEDYIYTLDDLNATLAESQQISISFGATVENLGDDLANIARNFNIAGLGDIGSGIGQLPDLFTDLKGSMSGIPGSLGEIKTGFGGLASGDILSGLSGLVGGIGGITSAISALSSAWSIGKSIWGGIKNLFGDSKSEGHKAAAAMRDFVDTNIEGGAELSAAMREMYGEMKQAGFDYGKFIQEQNIGALVQESFGGFSSVWQEGTTAMDLFSQAVGRATGNMEKAPQVSLQMVAALQEMGLSAEETGAKMLEIAQASGLSEAQVQALQAALGGVQEQLLGAGEEGEVATTMFDKATVKAAELTGTTDTLSGNLSTLTGQLSGAGAEGLATTNMFHLASGSAAALDAQTRQLSGNVSGLAGQMSGAGMETGITSGLFGEAGQNALGLKGDMGELGEEVEKSTKATQQLSEMLEDIPREIQIQVNFMKWTGDAPPGMAEGGIASGLALVGDKYGPEIARLPSGRSFFVGLEGPQILPFPEGTEIIPNRKIREYVRTHRVPAMAEGGTITAPDQNQPPQTIIEEHYHLNVYTRVIDRGTIKMIDEGLRQLKHRRS